MANEKYRNAIPLAFSSHGTSQCLDRLSFAFEKLIHTIRQGATHQVC